MYPWYAVGETLFQHIKDLHTVCAPTF